MIGWLFKNKPKKKEDRAEKAEREATPTNRRVNGNAAYYLLFYYCVCGLVICCACVISYIDYTKMNDLEKQVNHIESELQVHAVQCEERWKTIFYSY